MQNKTKNPEVIVAEIEGLHFDPDRLKAYENTVNQILFVVKWKEEEKRENLCLPVYTVENELIGYIRKDVEKIKELFIEYSDPFVLLVTSNNKSIIIELNFSHDKDYLENLRKRVELINKKNN